MRCSRSYGLQRKTVGLLGIAFEGKAEVAAQIDALGAGRSHAPDEFRRDGAAAALRPMVESFLHPSGVPRHEDVRKQAERVGDGLHLLMMLGLIARDPTTVDRTLQGIDGLAAIEYPEQLPTEGLIDEVVGEEHRAQWLPQMRDSLI